MEFKKINKIEAYRFYISDHVYCQCEIDLTGNDEKVEILYTIGNLDTYFSVQANLKYYARKDISNPITDIMEKDVKEILTDKRVWQDLFPDIFYNRKDYHLFAAEYEPDFETVQEL